MYMMVEVLLSASVLVSINKVTLHQDWLVGWVTVFGWKNHRSK